MVIVIVVIKGWLYHVIPLLVIGLIVGSYRFPGVIACHIVTIVITPTSPERTPLTVVVYPLISPELPQVGIERGITSRNSWNEFCLQYIQVFLEQFQLDDVQEGIILNLIQSHNCNWFLGGGVPFRGILDFEELSKMLGIRWMFLNGPCWILRVKVSPFDPARWSRSWPSAPKGLKRR